MLKPLFGCFRIDRFPPRSFQKPGDDRLGGNPFLQRQGQQRTLVRRDEQRFPLEKDALLLLAGKHGIPDNDGDMPKPIPLPH